MTRLPGKFVWFEHLSPELDRARAFYKSWLGWSSEPAPIGGQSYHLIVNHGQGIGGFRTAPADSPTHWHAFLSVADVDAAAERAQELGATLLMPPTDFAPVGRGCTVADPTGAVLSLWTANEGDMPDAERVPAGAWCWIELMTRDEAAAIAFYTGLIGYDDQPVPGSEPPYHLLANDGRPRAGLMRSPDPGLPSFWLPYVMTEDLPATVTAAVAAGATVRKDQTAIPGTGRFAVFGDPTGAVIGAFEPAPRG